MTQCNRLTQYERIIVTNCAGAYLCGTSAQDVVSHLRNSFTMATDESMRKKLWVTARLIRYRKAKILAIADPQSLMAEYDNMVKG